MTSTVLILGASGRFGRNAAMAFEAAGWDVRRFDRNSQSLMDAATGANVIVNAWNPPYPEWQRVVPGLTRQVIEAAKTSGATVLIPGNVYVFGKNAPERFSAETPHEAQIPLGRVRAEMEQAYRQSGVRTIILRAGDFLDTQPSGNWFDKVIVAKAGAGKFSYPGRLDAPHAWAYLPDLARAAVALAEKREGLERFEDVPFPGYTLTGQQLGEAVGRALGREIAIAQMNWLPLRLLAPVWATARCLQEMRYLWNTAHELDGARFAEVLPGFAATPLGTALKSALEFQVDPDKVVPQNIFA